MPRMLAQAPADLAFVDVLPIPLAPPAPVGPGAPKAPLYGIWNVQEMRMDDSFQGYPAKIDDAVKQLTLTLSGDKNDTATFAIDRPAADRLILDGTMGGHKVRFDMRLQDREKFLLVSRGFNWVQERPFNR